MNDRRATIKKENPTASMTDMTKIMTEEWKNLTNNQKAKWDKLAAADKTRYENERDAAGEGPKKKKGDTDGPKKPLSAYMVFGKEYREKLIK